MLGMRSLAVIVVVCVVLVACSGAGASPSVEPASTAPGPTDTPASTPSPSAPDATDSGPTPLPSATPGDSGLTPVTLLASTVNGLQLREGPTVAATPFQFPCNPAGGCTDPVVVNAGWTVMAFDGPIAADGYDWYLVQLDAGYPGSAHVGWAATPQSGDPWLVPADDECPSEVPDLETAIATGPLRLLYCFGDEPLSFEGYVVQGFGCNVIGRFEPEWLAHPCANMSFISPVASSDGDGRLFLHFPAPGVTNPTLELNAGQRVRIVGHFDDPAAKTCVIEADTVTAADPAAGIARCRARFAVTEVDAIP
jgi:hypothetical protein